MVVHSWAAALSSELQSQLLTAIQAAAPSFGLTCGLDALNTVLKCIYSVFGFSGMCVPPRERKAKAEATLTLF